MEVRYLSWLRGKIGCAEETVTLPPDVGTVDQLVDWLSLKSEPHKNLSRHRDVISVSVNGAVIHDWRAAAIADADQVSFFSPMAGG